MCTKGVWSLLIVIYFFPEVTQIEVCWLKNALKWWHWWFFCIFLNVLYLSHLYTKFYIRPCISNKLYVKNSIHTCRFITQLLEQNSRTQNSELFIWPNTFIFFYNNIIVYNLWLFWFFFVLVKETSIKVKWDRCHGSHLLWVVAKMKNIRNIIK